MAAVAQLPPLVNFGLLFGSRHTGLALNAFLLFWAHMICINLTRCGDLLYPGNTAQDMVGSKKIGVPGHPVNSLLQKKGKYAINKNTWNQE
jgi:hypothetical protein